MDKIAWGMIGCGEVTEVKSGPAFNKVADSYLLGVMSRSHYKAQSYAGRHGIPKIASQAHELFNDQEINAIYIATPPSSHEELALSAIAAGKHVYLEKPMAMSYGSALRIVQAAMEKGVKLSIAHYRREQPLFRKIRELLADNEIGDPLHVTLKHFRSLITQEQLKKPGVAWRLDPAISGGGLFHDVAPHQLDLLRFYFGDADMVSGKTSNTGGVYKSPDLITAQMKFASGVSFSGKWDFNSNERTDRMEIHGTAGRIIFEVFKHESFILYRGDHVEKFSFEPLEHAQLPMIAQVVQYFLGKSYNPCSGEDGAAVTKMADMICGNLHTGFPYLSDS